MIQITVKYSCVLCGLQKVSVQVPARPSEMAVEVWMAQTIVHVGDDHQKRSPTCQTQSLQELIIPISNAEWIGGPAVH